MKKIKDAANAAAAARILSRRFRDLSTYIDELKQLSEGAEHENAEDVMDSVAQEIGEIEERYSSLKQFFTDEYGLEE